MEGSADALKASVWELVSTFHEALVALTPAADRARLPWRDNYQHPDWETMTHSLFDAFVSAPIGVDGSSMNGVHRLTRFDIDYDDYSDLSWISPSPAETNLALIRLLTERDAFDTVEFAEIDPETQHFVRRTQRPWQQSDYVVVRRTQEGRMLISDAIVADD